MVRHAIRTNDMDIIYQLWSFTIGSAFDLSNLSFILLFPSIEYFSLRIIFCVSAKEDCDPEKINSLLSWLQHQGFPAEGSNEIRAQYWHYPCSHLFHIYLLFIQHLFKSIIFSSPFPNMKWVFNSNLHIKTSGNRYFLFNVRQAKQKKEKPTVSLLLHFPSSKRKDCFCFCSYLKVIWAKDTGADSVKLRNIPSKQIAEEHTPRISYLC